MDLEWIGWCLIWLLVVGHVLRARAHESERMRMVAWLFFGLGFFGWVILGVGMAL